MSLISKLKKVHPIFLEEISIACTEAASFESSLYKQFTLTCHIFGTMLGT